MSPRAQQLRLCETASLQKESSFAAGPGRAGSSSARALIRLSQRLSAALDTLPVDRPCTRDRARVLSGRPAGRPVINAAPTRCDRRITLARTTDHPRRRERRTFPPVHLPCTPPPENLPLSWKLPPRTPASVEVRVIGIRTDIIIRPHRMHAVHRCGLLL